MQEAHSPWKECITSIVSAKVCTDSSEDIFKESVLPFYRPSNGWTQILQLSTFPVEPVCLSIGSYFLASTGS